MANQPITLFGQFGLPEMSQEEYESQLRRAAPEVVRQQLGVQLGKGNAFQQAMAGFAGLAGAGGAKLSDQDKAKFRTVDQVRTSVKKMREDSPELWEAMDEEQKADYMQKQLIRYANENELPELGLAAARDFAQRKVERAQREAELAHLRQTTATSRASEQQTLQNIEIADAGKPGDYREFFDPKTGRGIAGLVLPGGYVSIDGERRHISELIPGGIYQAGLRALSAGRGGKDGAPTPHALFAKLVPASQMKEWRTQYSAFNKQASVTNRIYDMFEDALVDGFNPASFLDGSGKVINTLSNISSSLGGLIDAWAISDEERQAMSDRIKAGGPGVSQARMAAEHFKEEWGVNDFSEWIDLPEGLTIPAAEYESMIIELAYAVARANEPGARQLSDTDFKNAIKEIGAKAADPRKVVEVTFRRFGRVTADMEGAMNTLEGAVHGANTMGAPYGDQIPLGVMTEAVFGIDVGDPREQLIQLEDRRNGLMSILGKGFQSVTSGPTQPVTLPGGVTMQIDGA